MERRSEFAILTLDGLDDVNRLLRSLSAHLPDIPARVLVNGGAVDVVLALRDGWPNVDVVHRERNLGCPGGRNELARLSDADWLIFLDDDATVPEGAIARLVQAWESHPDADVVAGGVIDPYHVDPDTLPVAEVASFSGGVCAIDRRRFLHLGGYPSQQLREGEERDFAWRLLDSGGRIIRDPGFRIVHHVDESPARRTHIVRSGMSQAIRTHAHLTPAPFLILALVREVGGRFIAARNTADVSAWSRGLIDGVSSLWRTPVPRAPISRTTYRRIRQMRS